LLLSLALQMLLQNKFSGIATQAENQGFWEFTIVAFILHKVFLVVFDLEKLCPIL